jgi:predicted alpha/beta superfamily hydrolase
MKKCSIVFLLFAFVAGSGQSHDKIVIGTIDSVYSTILGETRKVWVYVPDQMPELYGKQKYPVVYLLDGEANFQSVVGIIQKLSDGNGNSILPKSIVVGIPNTDRTRDLTPTHVTSSPMMGTDFVKNSGGGERFTNFLEKELIPYIESVYPVAPYRMLIGHSFGGLIVVNSLIFHPDLFNSYVAIDPSLWWDNQYLLKQAKTIVSNKLNNKSFFLAIANTMQPGLDTGMVKADTTLNTLHTRSILQFSDLLKSNHINGLNWDYKYYKNEDHGSVPLIAEYDALRFIFKSYRFPPFPNMFDNNFNADSAIVSHYKIASDKMGYKVIPAEGFINDLAYNFLQRKMFSQAYFFFKMNTENHPDSFNVFDSMGDYYTAEEDKQKAIEFYSKALSIKKYLPTIEKVEKLKDGK